MSDIQVGDRVSWTHKPRYGADKKPRTMTGSVATIHCSRKPWAGIAIPGDSGWSGVWVVPLVQLTRVPVAADAAPAWGAPGDLRRACDADDYELMMNAGDLGGTEFA